MSCSASARRTKPPIDLEHKGPQWRFDRERRCLCVRLPWARLLGADPASALKSRMRQALPHFCDPSPGQATAWQAESASAAPTLPEALSVEPQ
jgi:hypothetical protein